MSLALELFLTAVGVIFAIVVVAEILWKAQKLLGKRD
jgi:hypothetical protein